MVVIVELLISRIRNISTLPAIVFEIIKTTNNPASSARDLNNIVTKDQAIAAKLLQMANSSYYGLSTKVKDLERAIALLGFNTVRSLALSISILDHFNGVSSSEYFNHGKFWEHSMGVAVLSKMLAEKWGKKFNPEEAYIGGLLHDLGIIVLDQFSHEDFAKILLLIYESDIDFLEAEKMVIGHDHAYLGAELAASWDFPELLITMISKHHNPEYNGNYTDYCHMVYLANVLDYIFTYSEDKRVPKLNEMVLQKFIPDDEQMGILRVKFETEMESNRAILKLFH